MKQLIAIVLALGAVMAIGQVSFDTSKSLEPLKTTDIVVAVECAVSLRGAARPILPVEFRKLRKADLCIYNAEIRGDISRCIVVMVLPQEHEAEFRRIVAEDDSLTEVTAGDLLALSGEYPGLSAAMAQLDGRVVTALTPYNAAAKIK